MADYPWRDKVDPASFTGKAEEGFKHYRAEWDRLSKLILESFRDPKFDRNERDEMIRERNHVAARVMGYSHYIVP